MFWGLTWHFYNPIKLPGKKIDSSLWISPQSVFWVKGMFIDLGNGRNFWFTFILWKAWTESLRSANVSYCRYVLICTIPGDFWNWDFSVCIYSVQWSNGLLGSNIPFLLHGWSVGVEFDAEIFEFLFSSMVFCLLHYCDISRKSEFLLFVGLTVI